MCFLTPLTVVQIKGGKALLENGIRAVCDPGAGIIKKGDRVMVYGNLIIGKADEKSK